MSDEELEELEGFFRLAANVLFLVFSLLKFFGLGLSWALVFAPIWVPLVELLLAWLACSVELWFVRRRNRR